MMAAEESRRKPVERCRWMMRFERRLPYRYHGTQYAVLFLCSKKECRFKNENERTGYCDLGGDMSEIPKEERP